MRSIEKNIFVVVMDSHLQVIDTIPIKKTMIYYNDDNKSKGKILQPTIITTMNQRAK